MRVFKLYMRIIKKNLGILSVYLIAFATISIIMTFSSIKDNSNKEFVQSKSAIAFFDEDNSELSKDLKKNLEKVAEIKDIEDNKEKLQDALFFSQISSIVRIEKGFSQKLVNGKEAKVEVNTIPNTYSSTYVELAINNYMNTAQGYYKNTNLKEQELIVNINKDLDHSTLTELMEKEASTEVKGTVTYFNYLAYVLLAVIILGVGITMSTINDKLIKRRMLCSPLSYKRLNIELTLGHFALAITTLVLLLLFWFIPKMELLIQPIGKLLVVNAICITLAILSIGYLIGSVVKSKSAQNAAANVISLTVCFISGVFVPQEFLNEVVIKIANFTPVYWYIKANTMLQEISSFNFESLKPIYGFMAIELGFAITVWLVALVIGKNKRMSD